ncbi:unnamed protein product [Victoria cruziana]
MAVAGSPKVQKKQKKNRAGKSALAAKAAVVSHPLPDGSTVASGQAADPSISSPRKRTKDPGVRIVGGRIYDSQNGRTCHQCRQKTMDLTASCKNVPKNKPCPIRFCFKCLLNRYGEVAEEINGMDSWNCPKCRGICNCSLCMKKKGENPTGILVHTAKATGFSSVSDMLRSGIDLNKCREFKSPKASSCLGTKMASDVSLETTVKSEEGALRKRKRGVGSTDVSHVYTKPSSIGKEVKKKKPSKLHIDSSKELGTQDTSNESGLRTYCHGPSEEVKTSKNATEKVVEPTRAGSDNPSEEETLKKAGTKKLSKQQRLKPAEKPSSRELVEEEKTGLVKVKSKRQQSKSAASKPSVTKLVKEENTGVEKVKSEEQQSKPAAKRSSVELVKEENTGTVKVNSKKERSKPAPSSMEVVNEENMGTVKAKSVQSKKIQSVLSMHHPNGKEKPPVSVKPESLQKIVQARIQEEDADVVLPQGEEVKEVAGIEFSADDVGPALQFLEFCAAFGKVLDLKRGQPESILRELTRGRRIERRGLYSSAAQFHVKLLDLLEDETEEAASPVLNSSTSGNLWLQQLHKCISKSPFALKVLPPEYLNRGPDEYSKLDPSKKLRLLNFLCEEALETEHLRNWIDEDNLKFREKKKEHNGNLVEVNKKEKDMKQKMKDEMARIFLSSRDGAPISSAESQDIISRIKKEADEAHAEKLKALELKSKFKRQRSDAVRTEHIVFDKSGRIYWRLSGGSSGSRILLQDVGNWDSALCQDRWFIYDDKQEKALEKYIFSLRKRHKSRRSNQVNLLDKENLQYQSPSNSSSPISAVEETAL